MSKKHKNNKELKFDRLDNTANLFPVVANESMTSVYRISATLTEDIIPEILQEALEKILPYFDIFNVRIKEGIFWFYFETNKRKPPKVEEESTYPCRYISIYNNRNYLFRVTYYKKRINLEVFHVITDGMGAITFLREMIYQYLRIVHPELKQQLGDGFDSITSLNKEDSYRKNYHTPTGKNYKTGKAYKIKGNKFEPNVLGVMHAYLDIPTLKDVARKFGVSINTYLVSVYTYAIYKECLNKKAEKYPIKICVPVNLRPFFDSNTTKNFFTVVGATFLAEKDEYTFEEIVAIINDSLKSQINKENLHQLISYGVSHERKLIVRMIPLFFKKMAIKSIYYASANANTTTLTNVGNVEIREEYAKYIERFHVVLSMTKGQDIKASVISYQDELVLTISTGYKDVDIQKSMFRKLQEDGNQFSIETNGVYYE